MTDAYRLPLDLTETSRRLATGWLLLAVSALAVGGLFVFLLALSRTPGIQEIIPWVDFFKTALVVHVDLTVLVWFLAFAGALWSLNSRDGCNACGWAALLMAVVGAVVIALSPFLGAGGPFMNNYVPVLMDPIFFTGLGLFGAGFTLLVLRGLFLSHPVGRTISAPGALRFGFYTALIAALLAVMALLWSYRGIPPQLGGEHYYELLFWGGGHVIQFTHTQLMLAVWLWLAALSGFAIRATPRILVLLFALGLAPALLTPVLYFLYEINSGDHIRSFTLMMQYGGGLAAVPVGLVLLLTLKGAGAVEPEARIERSALLYSMLLFGIGGIIGFMITGSNVRIPAHYHGSIVGVTLAFMGITYHLLPRLGFRRPSGKWVNRQPAIYGIGQLLWVLAMAYTGGHGVARKTAGTAQGLQTLGEQIAMGIMGVGALIAISGGIIYMVAVFRAVWPGKAGGE